MTQPGHKFFCLLLLLLLSGPLVAKERYTIDDVAIGMTYQQVLEVRGLPKSIGQKHNAVFLNYPTPQNRSSEPMVWFENDRVVYATGYSLYRDNEPLFLYGMTGLILKEEFGESQPLNLFATWWPQSGVVLNGNNRLSPEGDLTSPLGLRDPDFPIDRLEAEPGKRWSRYEPWLDDERLVWLADDVELGMAQERAQKLAGDLEVVYEAGFVRAVRSPQSVLLFHTLGQRDLSLQFEAGEEPLGLGSHVQRWPSQGWYSPAPGGRVQLQSGKVAQVELELTCKKLFAALTAYRASGDGSRGRERDRERSRQAPPRAPR